MGIRNERGAFAILWPTFKDAWCQAKGKRLKAEGKEKVKTEG